LIIAGGAGKPLESDATPASGRRPHGAARHGAGLLEEDECVSAA